MLKLKDSGLVDTNTLIILLIIVVAVIILFVPKQITIVRERKAFNHARDIVHSIGEQTAQKIKPIKQGPSDYCEYGRVKFGRGGLSCQTNYYLMYDLKDDNEVTQKLMLIQESALKQNIKADILRTSKGAHETSVASMRLALPNMHCKTWAYVNDDDTETHIQDVPFALVSNSVVFDVNCQNLAHTEHFPIRD